MQRTCSSRLAAAASVVLLASAPAFAAEPKAAPLFGPPATVTPVGLPKATTATAKSEPAGPASADKARGLPRVEVDGGEQVGELDHYGGEILISDVVAIGLGGAAVGAGSPTLGVLSGATYLLVPALIHKSHHDGWMPSGKSVATRIAVPIGAILLTSILSRSFCDKPSDVDSATCSTTAFARGIAVGFAGAMLLDAGAIAKSPYRPRSSPFALAPSFRASSDSGWFGLSGRF